MYLITALIAGLAFGHPGGAVAGLRKFCRLPSLW